MKSVRIVLKLLLEIESVLIGVFSSLVSCTHEVLACCGWHLSVSHRLTTLPFSQNITNTKGYVSSWEFITTLDFEWSIMQGRRRYRWTIWVCSDSSSFWTVGEMICSFVDLLPFAYGSSCDCN